MAAKEALSAPYDSFAPEEKAAAPRLISYRPTAALPGPESTAAAKYGKNNSSAFAC